MRKSILFHIFHKAFSSIFSTWYTEQVYNPSPNFFFFFRQLSLLFPWLFVARLVPPLLVLPSTAPTAILIIIPKTPAINFMAIPLAIPSMANRGDHRAVPLLPVLPAAMHLPVLPGSHGFLLPGPIISPRPITCKAPRPPPPLLL